MMQLRQIPWVATALLNIALLCQACDLERPSPEDRFYCKVNGKHWRPNRDGDLKASTLKADLTNQNKDLYIRASDNKRSETISIAIANNDSIKAGVYELSVITRYSTLPPSASFYSTRTVNSMGQVHSLDYKTNKTHMGTFRILSLEKDFRNPTIMKMQAEFEFTAVSPTGEKVKITNGQYNGEVRILSGV
jgi:hypothetical protein